MSQRSPDCIKAVCRSCAQPQNTGGMAEARAQPPGHPTIGYIQGGKLDKLKRRCFRFAFIFCHDSRLTKTSLKFRSKIIPVILKRHNEHTYLQ